MRAVRYWRIFIVIALGEAACVCALAQSVRPLPDLPDPQHFEEAIAKEVTRAYHEAASHPHDAERVGQLGMLFHAHRQNEAAAACYTRARALDEKDFHWPYYLGMVLAELGDSAGAVDSLEIAIDIRPDYFPARLRLAAALLSAGAPERARTHYQRLAGENPRSARAHYGLGRALAAIGRFDEAEKNYGMACKLFPEYGASHYALALLLLKRGQKEEGQKRLLEYRRAGGKEPPLDDPVHDLILALKSGSRYHLELGLSYQDKGDFARARLEYEKALEADPRYAEAHLNLLSLAAVEGRAEDAERHYQAALAINPNLPEAYYNLGIIRGGAGQEEEARRLFEKAIEMNPYYAEAHNNLGSILVHQGNLQAAEGHFRAAIAAKPGYRVARYNLARVLLKQEKPREAIEHLLETIRVEDRDTPLFLYTLADAHARAGSLKEAVEAAENARDMARKLGQKSLAERINKELSQIRKTLGHRK